MDLPTVGKPIVDRLVYVLPLAADCTLEEQRAILQPILNRLKIAVENGICEKAFLPSYKTRYIEKFKIVLSSKQKILVQIGAINPERQKGGINVTMNPSRLTASQVRKLHEVMASIIGSDYHELIKSPILNRADFAVDIDNISIDDLLVTYQHAQRHTVFGKRIGSNGKIEGYNFGSVNSDYIQAVYDKRTERIHAALVNVVENSRGRDELHKNSVKRFMRARDGHEVTRVEVRAMRLRGYRPHELSTLPNRFARFRFADLTCNAGPNLSELDRTAFLSMCRHIGVKAALALYKRERPDIPVRAFWEAKRAGWWNPEALWINACDALRESGIFPECAFSKPEVHNAASALPTKKVR
ncbi:hypothetical protein [Burkholderia sp. LMG 21824]|uniref:hypothetical protein n=1 Tax=Burkholderia sp. LMG 21824 TaxID=3158172 RepID=UPI003C2CAB98